MNLFFSLLLLYLVGIIHCQYIPVYYSPGGYEDYLKMTKHPGAEDLKELTVCLRLATACKVLNHKKIVFRWYSVNMHKGGISSGQVTLAAVMEGEGNGNKDEFFYLSMVEDADHKDDLGRSMGSYIMTTKGFPLSCVSTKKF